MRHPKANDTSKRRFREARVTASYHATLWMALAAMLLTPSIAAADGLFAISQDSALQGPARSTLTQKTVDECMRQCLSETKFECQAFDYRKRDGTCRLSDKRAGKRRAPGYAHFVLTAPRPEVPYIPPPKYRSGRSSLTGAVQPIAGTP